MIFLGVSALFILGIFSSVLIRRFFTKQKKSSKLEMGDTFKDRRITLNKYYGWNNENTHDPFVDID
jgi:hypothetical protein